MKKLLCMLLALLAIGRCALAEAENAADEAVRNIFTWEGYIDYETVIKPFEQGRASRSTMRPSPATKRCMKSSPRYT